jgi:hypothetical protein
MLAFAGTRIHAYIIAAAFAVVVAIRIGLRKYYVQQYQQLQVHAYKDRRQEFANSWNSLTYTNASGSALADVVLSRIDWPSLQLNEIQRDRLKVRLRETFGFLGNPEFETYCRLKLEGSCGHLELSRSAAQRVSRLVARADPSEALEPMRALRILWEGIFPIGDSAEAARITEMSFDRVRAAVSTTNSHGAILSGKVSNGFTVIEEALDPGFYYAGQTNAVSSDAGYGLFFHLSFFARSSTSTNAGPVYLSLYWSGPDENWA